jgi:hypothetical protein
VSPYFRKTQQRPQQQQQQQHCSKTLFDADPFEAAPITSPTFFQTRSALRLQQRQQASDTKPNSGAGSGDRVQRDQPESGKDKSAALRARGGGLRFNGDALR